MKTIVDFAVPQTQDQEFKYQGHAAIRYFMMEACDYAVETPEFKVHTPVYRKVKHVNWTKEGFEAAYAQTFGCPKKELRQPEEPEKVKGWAVKRRSVNVNYHVDTKF